MAPASNVQSILVLKEMENHVDQMNVIRDKSFL